MAIKHFSFFTIIGVIIVSLTACNKNDKGFTLTGTLQGLDEGKVIFIPIESAESKPDTVLVQKGQFVYKGSVAEPSMYYMMVEGKPGTCLFYMENGKITISANVDSLQNASFTGSITQEDYNRHQQMIKEIYAKYNMDSLYKELYPGKGKEAVSEQRRTEIESIIEQTNKEVDASTLNFIKDNRKSYYSLILVSRMVKGMSADKIEGYLKMLDPKIAETPRAKKLTEELNEAKKTDVDFATFIKDAHNVKYTVDATYAGKQHLDVAYLSTLSDNTICALKNDGTVLQINPKGAVVKEFKTDLKASPTAITVDKNDNIYVLGGIKGKVQKKLRGRIVEVEMPIGVECGVYDKNGNRLRSLQLDSCVVSATGARVSGDNKLLVADTRNRVVAIFDAQTGERKAIIEKLRTCCGILDFSIRNDNEVLVADLGAFRVNGFDFTGKKLFSFGQRGESINDFHGCCNPVSVAYLSNGAIVTVEKDPTRIKVYSHEGACAVEGIDELVKGCAYIPMTVDKNDNLYLASRTGGIIKCSPAI